MNKISLQVDLKAATSLNEKTVIQYISRDAKRELYELAVKQKRGKYARDSLEEFLQPNVWQMAIAQFKTHSHRKKTGLPGEYTDWDY
jgi:hypothetical protein